jgi:D-arginine dehydrogenase
MGNVVDADFLIIGAGIAGASVAAHLAAHGRVVLLEMENQPGYHSTGRSAALFSEIYGNELIRGLTRASRAFLFYPPPDFAAAPLTHPRPALFFARPDQMAALDAFLANPHIGLSAIRLSASEIRERLPLFRDGYLAGGAIEEGSADLDVNAIHQGFLRQAKKQGATLHINSRVAAIIRSDERWLVKTDHTSFRTPIVINAAGAWGDEIAKLAAIEGIGLEPKRRTACLISVPGGANANDWPAAVDISEEFYFKPDAGLLLLSPADEHPCLPCDVQPEELDVAIAVDRFENAIGQSVKHVRHQWAGLRVFAPDRTPVVGFDASVEGFFWLVGQGGYGIQTSPAMGRLAAALVRGLPVPDDILSAGITASHLSPCRFRKQYAPDHAQGFWPTPSRDT